jgi:hypothetical protein
VRLDLDVLGLELSGGPGEHALGHLAKIDGFGLGTAPDRLPVRRNVRLGSKALRALSHQHHQGLFAAPQLKRAGRETAVEARQVFLDFYEREGSRHFRAEEELLLPAFARHTGVDDPAIVRVLFPMIEEALPVDELERLGAAFARAETDGE